MTSSTSGFLRDTKNWIGEILFPDVCSFCGIRMASGGSGPIALVCRKCHGVIPFRTLRQRQLMCMDPREYYRLLPASRAINPIVYVACHYEEPIRKALIGLKFYEANYMKEPLGNIMYYALSREIMNMDYLIPIPLHPDRLKERGYNQACLIAHTIARQCGKPLVSDYLFRTQKTHRQSEMKNKSERAANVEGVFSCRDTGRIKNGKIGVIDDVMTSGCTMYAAINAIYDAAKVSGDGNKKIDAYGFVVASDRK